MDLRAIYLAALARCDPAALVAERIAARPELQDRPVVALGKCASRMAAGLARGGWRGRGLAIVPAGYETNERPGGFEIVLGSHPYVDEASFRAGDALLRFVESVHAPVLVLLSGGASAAAEAPLAPHVTRAEVAAINEQLVRAGLPIAKINVVRKHLSAIKGGRLGTRLLARSETWVLSDVPPGHPEIVGSGPTCADPSSSSDAVRVLESIASDTARRLAAGLRSGAIPETPKRVDHPLDVIADNGTLIGAAEEVVGETPDPGSVLRVDERAQLDLPVEAAALFLADMIPRIGNRIGIFGGEPTVVVRGPGTGGRCSELGLRLLRLAARQNLRPFSLLVASSDGRDGNSGAAGYILHWTGAAQVAETEIERALAASDAHSLAARLGEVIQIPPTGNNLRDIMMMARR